MDLETLSRLLRELLLVNDRVSLPGMGGFIAELAPSVFSDRATVIHPPYRRILFRTSEVWNDGMLEALYAEENGLELEKARKEIEAFVKEFRAKLNLEKSVQIPGFGTMRATDQRDYFFVADKDLFIYPDGYGLEPVNIRPLAKPGLIELLDEDERRLSSQTAHSVKPAVVRKPYSSASKKVSAVRPVLVNIAIVLLILIILAALAVIFKDQLKPFWEWLLYNKEERELLKYIR